jgi:hypothetical protein
VLLMWWTDGDALGVPDGEAWNRVRDANPRRP